MNRRTVSTLAALSTVVVIISGSLWIQGKQATGEDGFREAPQAAWVERLKHRLKDARSIRIEGKGNPITLQRRDDVWRVSQFHGYPARSNAITTLLDDLARMEARFVSDVPLSHAKYGVANAPGSTLGSGTELELRDGEDRVLVKLVMGQTVHIPGDDGVMRVQAVRRAMEDEIWLFSPIIEMSIFHMDWVNSQIVQVPSSEVSELTAVSRDGGESLVLKRMADKGEIGSSTQGDRPLSERESLEAERLMGSFANVRFDTVREVSPATTATKWRRKTSIVTLDGIVYEARLWSEDGTHWMSIMARPAGLADEGEVAQIVKFNKRHKGWAYRLSPAMARNLIISPKGFIAE